MENRMVVIMKTLEEGGGVSYELLSGEDLRELTYHYGEKALYIGMMGGHLAIRLIR